MDKLTEDCDVDLLSMVGHGAVGVVHVGKLDVAIKRICYIEPNGEKDEEKFSLGHKEIDTLKKIKSHRNVVQFYNYKDDGSSLWIIMEKCDLGSLDRYLNRIPGRKMKLKIIKECVDAIQFIHSLNIIHYDLKPSNILLKRDANSEHVAKISDFSGSGQFGSGQLGTETFMAPELYMSTSGEQSHDFGVSLDIFSLGLVFQIILLFSEDHRISIPKFVGNHKAFSSFGQAMLTAKKHNNDIPKLFDDTYTKNDEYLMILKNVVENMTVFDPACRMSLSDVSRELYTALSYALKNTELEEHIIGLENAFTDSRHVNTSNYMEDLGKKIGGRYWGAYSFIELFPSEIFTIKITDDNMVMNPDFTVERLMHGTKKIREMKKHYIQIEYDDIMSLILDFLKDDSQRLIICKGNPGCGKTVFAHRLIMNWVNQYSKLSNMIEAIFFIPLRQFNQGMSFLEILTKQTGLSDTETTILQQVLEEKKTARHVLLLLDGLDEISLPTTSELFKVITGDKYRHCKVMITTRPEALRSPELIDLWPDYLINLYGVTDKSVYHFLKLILTPDHGHIEAFLQTCEKYMFNFSFLKNPSLLSLLAVALNERWAKHLVLTHGIVPKTITESYGCVVGMILRIWLSRMGRYDESYKLNLITKNLIDRNNMVPIDIKAKLVSFGALSHNAIMQSKYMFTEDDFEMYLIDKKDVQFSGLFSYSTSDEHGYFYCRHKSIQEYLSAIYLCHRSFKRTSLCEFLSEFNWKTKREMNEETYSLPRVLGTTEVVFQFLAGLSPIFITELLSVLLKQFETYVFSESYKQDYELWTKIVLEAQDIEVTKLVFQLFDRIPQPSVEKLNTFCKSLPLQDVTTILEDLYINFVGYGTHHISNLSSDISFSGTDLWIKRMTVNTYLLLHRYPLSNVDFLKVDISELLLVDAFLRKFDRLKVLIIKYGSKLLNNAIDVFENVYIPEKKSHLAEIQIGGSFVDIPQSTLQVILDSRDLCTLKLWNVDPLRYVHQCKLPEHMWQNLHTLDLQIKDLNDTYNGVMDTATTYTDYSGNIHNLGTLLSQAQCLKELSLFCIGKNNASSSALTVLMEIIGNKETSLHSLRMYNILHEKHFELLFGTLLKLRELYILGLGGKDMESLFDNTDRPFKKIRMFSRPTVYIRSLEILYKAGFEDVAEEVKSTFMEKYHPFIRIQTLEIKGIIEAFPEFR